VIDGCDSIVAIGCVSGLASEEINVNARTGTKNNGFWHSQSHLWFSSVIFCFARMVIHKIKDNFISVFLQILILLVIIVLS
jgi:hypothetical protein